jgi:hypothetical protein
VDLTIRQETSRSQILKNLFKDVPLPALLVNLVPGITMSESANDIITDVAYIEACSSGSREAEYRF